MRRKIVHMRDVRSFYSYVLPLSWASISTLKLLFFSSESTDLYCCHDASGRHQLLPSYALVQAFSCSEQKQGSALCSLFYFPSPSQGCTGLTPPDDLAVSRAIVPSLCLGPAHFPRSPANSWISHVSPFSISPVIFHRDYNLACHWGVIIKVSVPIFILRYLSKKRLNLTYSLQNCLFFSLLSPIE